MWLDQLHCLMTLLNQKTYAQVVHHTNEFHKEWSATTDKEVKSRIVNNTWTRVLAPLNKRTIGCVWIFKIKRDPNGDILKFKARLCARGDQHTRDIDYNAIFAPTLRYTTLRVSLSFAWIF